MVSTRGHSSLPAACSALRLVVSNADHFSRLIGMAMLSCGARRCLSSLTRLAFLAFAAGIALLSGLTSLTRLAL